MKNKKILYLSIILLIILINPLLFNFYPNVAKIIFLLVVLTLSIVVTSKSFIQGFLLNTIILFIIPVYLSNSDFELLKGTDTHSILFLVIYLFLVITINFFIMAYNLQKKITISNKYQKYIPFKNIKELIISLMVWFNKNQNFFKIVAIFIQYITLLFCILRTFAFLYIYLGNIFNEGIECERNILNAWDSIYFSATTFFTIGFGDITPHKYSEITKVIVIVQAIIGHLITTVFWPVVIIFAFRNNEE